MKCPYDKTELILKSQQNTFAHCCPKCKAVFLKAKGVDAFKFNFTTDLLEKSFTNSQTKPSSYSCSHCSKIMDYVEIDDMNILICKNCRSAFFEEQQLTKIKNKYYPVSDSEVALMGCLPPSFFSFFALFKYLSLEDDSKYKKYYGWIFVISVLLIILFWK